ncbi:MAG: HEAT repeat domain-containing protein [Actinomycetota bacterium]|nr:HEAT repeat domain-containing protein [Actinomycetota bacterium]
MDPDHARRLAVERGLAAAAFGHLTDAFTALPFEALGPTKTLLKRFFSVGPWGSDDDAALAAAVGPGGGSWERPLDADLTLLFGWDARGFGVEVRAGGDIDPPDGGAPSPAADPLAADFDGPVVPEATPSPRTIRFAVGRPLTEGASHWFASAEDAVDPRVARVFREFDEVTGVLVGPDFVAVMLRRPADWERLLRPVLAVVTEEFSEAGDERAAGRTVAAGGPAGAGAVAVATPLAGGHRSNRLEQAWRELGSLRPAEPDDLAALVAAAGDADRYRRQVAANLLREADPGIASAEWSRLVVDPAGAVRRAAVDALVDAGREELRPLLESALADTDAWVRWKALRGLVELGPGPSREAIAACAGDADFRVRLEASGALRSLTGS